MDWENTFSPAAAGRRIARLGLPGLGLGALAACSAMPVKMQCQEIRTRIAMENMSADQLRFAEEELQECERRQKDAEHKDSTWADSAHNRFPPPSE